MDLILVADSLESTQRLLRVVSKSGYRIIKLIESKAFKILRETDETIYLQVASLNIMNGLVGLNFSCDGTHYMPADNFLDKDMRF